MVKTEEKKRTSKRNKRSYKDSIVWTKKESETKWVRYTNLMALLDILEFNMGMFLDGNINSIVREYLGNQDYIGQKMFLQKIEREPEIRMRSLEAHHFDARRRRDVEIWLNSHRLKTLDSMRAFLRAVEDMDLIALRE